MIEFHSVNINYILPFTKNFLTDFLLSISRLEGKSVSTLKYIFTSDEYLLHINKEFLNHNYLTDVITFDSSDYFGIKGEVFISIEYVKANYLRYSLSYKKELLRCIVHGMLHLFGYNDDTAQNRIIMRNMENHYLGLI